MAAPQMPGQMTDEELLLSIRRTVRSVLRNDRLAKQGRMFAAQAADAARERLHELKVERARRGIA